MGLGGVVVEAPCSPPDWLQAPFEIMSTLYWTWARFECLWMIFYRYLPSYLLSSFLSAYRNCWRFGNLEPAFYNAWVFALSIPFGRDAVGEETTRIESMASGSKYWKSALKNRACLRFMASTCRLLLNYSCLWRVNVVLITFCANVMLSS